MLCDFFFLRNLILWLAAIILRMEWDWLTRVMLLNLKGLVWYQR